MKPPLFLALAGLLLAAVVLAWLNVREVDDYPYGRLGECRFTPVPNEDDAFRRIVPETITHDCPTCGSCAHKVEVLENGRQLSVEDRDGWYRLFWADPEMYHYDDPVYMAAALNNATAMKPHGRWAIRVRCGPASQAHDKTDACKDYIGETSLHYSLMNLEEPAEDARDSRGFATRVNWFSYRYYLPPHEHIVHFAWALSRN